MVRTDDVTITYVAHDRHTYRRNELWRRTNAAWSDVAERCPTRIRPTLAERLRRDREGGRPRTGPELAASDEDGSQVDRLARSSRPTSPHVVTPLWYNRRSADCAPAA